LAPPIAGARCWRGIHAIIAEIAAAEKINESYVSRVLRLMALIVEAILNGQHLLFGQAT
jgi:hypothetical protein